MNRNRLIVAGLVAGVVAVAVIGYGMIGKTRLPDQIAKETEAILAPLVAAVDVAFDNKGEPIAVRPVVLTTSNQVVGYAEPHSLSQINEPHTFVKGAPPEVGFFGGVATSRLLVGEFTCFDRSGIRMVRLDSHTDDFCKVLTFIANEDYRTSMSFAADLKSASTGRPQYVISEGYRMVCVERGGGFGGRGFVNYNLPSLQGHMTWVNQTPSWTKRSFVDGESSAAVLTQALMVGLEIGCSGGTSSNGGWDVRCGGTLKF